MEIIDLSVTITNDLIPYPGDPVIKIVRVSDIRNNGYDLTKIHFGSHTGTHVDMPRHYLKDGADTVKVPIDNFCGSAIVSKVILLEKKLISIDDVDLSNVKKDDIFLLSTGWEERQGSRKFFEDLPMISKDIAEYLVMIGIKAFGTDLPSVDNREDAMIHKILLRNDIVIFESLINLEQLVNIRFEFFGVPLKIAEADGSPIRAFAIKR